MTTPGKLRLIHDHEPESASPTTWKAPGPLMTEEIPAPPATEDAPAAVLATAALSLRYRGRPAFTDVSLPIVEGRVTAVIGPSGCGKTSFLSTLNRLVDLIPGAEASGRVLLRGVDVLGPGVDVIELRRRIGMVFQKPNPFPLSVRRNIELPLREHGVRKGRNLDEIVQGVLRDVGLWDEVKDRLNGPALALSGGQQQRLTIARALALRPEVVLFDEPCGALDPISSGVVEDLIVSLRGRYTVVVVTHNLAQARRIADRVGVFWLQEGAGRLIEHGPAAQVFEAPHHPLTAAYVRGERG